MLRIVRYSLLLLQQLEPGTRAYGAPWMSIRTNTTSLPSHFQQGDFEQGGVGYARTSSYKW